MTKNRLNGLIVVACAAVLILSAIVVTGGLMNEEQSSMIVMIEIRDVQDLASISYEGGDILETYPNMVLAEIPEKGLERLRSLGISVNTLPARTRVSVKSHTFDITEGMPEFGEELTIDGYGAHERGLYIVHTLGPVHPRWVGLLEKAEVELINYIPNYAFEARMTPEQAYEVQELYFVDWIGIYQPGFKLAPDLEPGIVNIRLVDDIDIDSLNTLTSMIDLYSYSSLAGYGSQILAEVGDAGVFSQIARMPEVYHISNYREIELHDEMATQIIGGGCWIWDPDDDPDYAYRGHGDYGSLANQLGYTGEGVVIAVADTGIGDGTIGNAGHQDFTGRVIGGHSFQQGNPSWADGHSHGTHCAGSAAGDTHNGTGSTVANDYYSAQGSAPKSDIFAVKVFDSSGTWIAPEDIYLVAEVANQMADAYVHTNSWGAAEGSIYDSRSEAFDKAVRDSNRDTGYNEPMVITTSAGNAGSYSSIGVPATGKNVITVGASGNHNPGARGGTTPNSVASFSSRGWTADFRVKPDLQAPGDSIYSTMPGGGYGTKSGTSMSNPAVAGAAAVVVEWYETYYDQRPSPAMVKAMLINTAHDMDDSGNTGPIPNRDEGWGMVNLPALVYAESDFVFRDEGPLVTTGEVHEYLVEAIDHTEPFKISLVWTDKEGIGHDVWTLKNNLDLEVISPEGDVYRGNAFSGGWTVSDTDAMSPFDTTGDGWDDVNNVQNVYIPSTEVQEGFYTVRIRGTNVPADANNDGHPNQDYALVVYNGNDQIPGEPPEISVTRPQGGEVFTAGEVEEITWNTEEGDDPIEHVSLYYSPDGGNQWTVISSQIPDTGSYLWTVPNVHSTDCLVKATVRDVAGRTNENEGGTFTIEGVPPAPPSNVMVEHFGETGIIGVYEEDFSDMTIGSPPPGWTSYDNYWVVQGSSLAGGTAPELVFNPGSGTSWYDSWTMTPAIDTSGQSELDLSFRHHLDNSGGYTYDSTFSVRVSTDGSSWTNVWSVSTSIDIEAEEVDISLNSGHGVGSETFYISWDWRDAWPNAIGAWYIDDIMLSREGTDVGDEHNLITWDASPDDPDWIDAYNIYRSESSTGPWDTTALIHSVHADGSPEYGYVDRDKGTGDDIFWWYVVRAVGSNGFEEENENAVIEPGAEVTSMDIHLYAEQESGGWNFVSHNLILQDSTLGGILEHGELGISGSYDRVMYYDAREGKWLSYVPGRPEHFNNLQTWDRTMGIWIRMSTEDTLTVEGIPPGTTSVELLPGWNMIGLPSAIEGNHGLPAEVTSIGYFQGSSEYNIEYTDDVDTFIFEPGKGYWVYNSAHEPVTWTVHY